MIMQIAGFISEYLLEAVACQRIPTSQQRFDDGDSLSSFDSGVNYSEKGCLHLSFVIRLGSLLTLQTHTHNMYMCVCMSMGVYIIFYLLADLTYQLRM